MSAYTLEDLLQLMSRLRDPADGCPWDQAQSFSSIAPHTIEEAYELADAIASGDQRQIKEELGDLLFQVVFLAQIGQEAAQFDFNGVVSELVEKLLRRHPHVFPAGSLSSRSGQQSEDLAAIHQQWEQTKALERSAKAQTALLDDIPQALPALIRAAKLQKRAAQVGFDWDDTSQVLAKLDEEMAELEEARQQLSAVEVEEELGDVLFTVVNLARHLKVDAESALRSANRKFERRFSYIEQTLLAAGQSLAASDQATLERLWEDAKRQGL